MFIIFIIHEFLKGINNRKPHKICVHESQFIIDKTFYHLSLHDVFTQFPLRLKSYNIFLNSFNIIIMLVESYDVYGEEKFVDNEN
jgi:hypothetical protein